MDGIVSHSPTRFSICVWAKLNDIGDDIRAVYSGHVEDNKIRFAGRTLESGALGILVLTLFDLENEVKAWRETINMYFNSALFRSVRVAIFHSILP